ncbi:MAG TPA: T9SS type A sorting domain-containing protein, partial [Cytophagaceae bacterium]|nr:T9SS type A sorting domain-containing protein [Cytophagaceae bacterium]
AGCGEELSFMNVHLSNDNIIVNVVNDAASCTIAIYTLLGQQIHTEAHDLDKGLNTFIVNYPGVNTEAYIIRVISGNEAASKKIFLIKNR